MSWEDQGRQENGEFGDGTTLGAGEGDGRGVGCEEVAGLVVSGAAAFLDGGLRGAF